MSFIVLGNQGVQLAPIQAYFALYGGEVVQARQRADIEYLIFLCCHFRVLLVGCVFSVHLGVDDFLYVLISSSLGPTHRSCLSSRCELVSSALSEVEFEAPVPCISTVMLTGT